MTSLGPTAFLVPDYDEAIAFLRDGLGLSVRENTDLGGGKRWVVMGGASGGALLLAKAKGAAQEAAVGDQHGGRVGHFAETDDFAGRKAALEAAGAVFEEAPRHEAYGTVAVFRDPWGNRWDLIQRSA